MDPNRIRELSGIDPRDDEFDASMEREKKIEGMIRHAFEKVGLEINYNNYSINYDDGTREAVVTLEDDRVNLHTLNRLPETGLSDQFVLSTHGPNLAIEFKVSHEMDHATIA